MQDEKKLQEERERLKKQQSYLPKKHEYLEYFNSIDIESDLTAGVSKTTDLQDKEAHARRSTAKFFWLSVKNFKTKTYFLSVEAKINKTEKEINSLSQYLKESPLRPVYDDLSEEAFNQSGNTALFCYLDFLKWYLEYLRPEPENKVLGQKIKLKEVSGYTETDLKRLFYHLYQLGIFEGETLTSFIEKVRTVFDLGDFDSKNITQNLNKNAKKYENIFESLLKSAKSKDA